MMVLHIVAAGRCRKVKLMAGEVETATGGCDGAVKFIVGIFHAILGKYRPQPTLVKWPVVSHKGQSLNKRLYLRPYLRKCRLSVGIPACQAMYLGSPISIVIGCRLNKRVEFVDNLTSAHNDHTDTTHVASSSVGRLKINRNKVLHCQSFLYSSYNSEIQPFMVLRSEAGLMTSTIAPTCSSFITKS